MDNIQFYFLKEEYYKDFPDAKLMQNKEDPETGSRKRPCFFVLEDEINPKIKWLVPISSKYKKYEIIIANKVKKYGKCNNIIIGEVLGKPRAFLIQNICPATENT